MKVAYFLVCTGLIATVGRCADSGAPRIYANNSLASGTVTSVGPVPVRIDPGPGAYFDLRLYLGFYNFTAALPRPNVTIPGAYGFWESTYITVSKSTYLIAGNWVKSPAGITWVVCDPVYFDITPLITITVEAGTGGSAIPGTGAYPQGTTVTYTATPLAGWSFVKWSGSIDSTNNPLGVGAIGAPVLRPLFASSLNIVTPSHGTISASTNASGLLLAGTQIKFTATPEAGYYFTGWTGPTAPVAANPEYNYVHMTADAQISASFAPIPPTNATLIILQPTNGSITLFSYRGDITPTNIYTLGEMMFARAVPNDGYSFGSWSGDAAGRENPIIINLDQSKTISANFEPGFTVAVNQTDGGVINYSSRKAVYPAGTILDLQAVAANGFEFAGWSGEVDSAQPTIELVVNTNINLFARFRSPVRRPLWTYQSPSSAVYDPAVDAQGKVYVTNRRGVIALDSAGNLQWRTLTADGTTMTNVGIAIERSGNVRVVSGSSQNGAGASIQRLNPAGDIVGSGVTIPTRLSGMALDSGGGVYLGGARISAIASNDIVRWEFRGGLPAEQNDGYVRLLSRPAMNTAGNIFFTGAYSVNAGGATRLSVRTPANAAALSQPLRVPTLDVDSGGPGVNDWSGRKVLVDAAPVLGNGRIYVTDFDGSLLALDANGAVVWRFATLDVFAPPSIGVDGTLYFGAKNSNRFYAVNADGTVRWIKKPGVGNYTVPAIGSDGTIYVSDVVGLYALDANGNRQWEFDAPLQSPVIAGNQVYATADSLYAFEATGTGVAASPWPMRNASARNDSAEIDLQAPHFDRATIAIEPGGFRARVSAETGMHVALFGSSDLQTWTLVAEQVAVNGATDFINLPLGTTAQRFYKAQLK